MLVCNFSNSCDICDNAARICKAFNEDCAGAFIYMLFEVRWISCFGPAHLPAKRFESLAKLVHRTAIELVGSDEIIAGL
ncbi:hypothetical protein D9M72_645800 [compost metagenome]